MTTLLPARTDARFVLRTCATRCRGPLFLLSTCVTVVRTAENPAI